MSLSSADQWELLCIRADLAAIQFEWSAFKFDLALRKYNPAQPRVPAGSPGGGQWTSESAPAPAPSHAPEAEPFDDITHGIGKGKGKASGGIARELWNLTARQFVSRYCQGHINREIPGEFYDMTIADILELRRGGDKAAKKCVKILNQPRFRKQ